MTHGSSGRADADSGSQLTTPSAWASQGAHARLTRWSPYKTFQKSSDGHRPALTRHVASAPRPACSVAPRLEHVDALYSWGHGDSELLRGLSEPCAFDRILLQPRSAQLHGPLVTRQEEKRPFLGSLMRHSMLQVPPQNPGHRPSRNVYHGRFSGKQLCGKSVQVFARPCLVPATGHRRSVAGTLCTEDRTRWPGPVATVQSSTMTRGFLERSLDFGVAL